MIGEKLSNLGAGTARWAFPPIHPEGRKYGLIAAAVTLLFFLLGWTVVGWLAVALTVWVFAFFRDPVRVTPLDDRFVVAPADGLITQIARVPPPRELVGPGLLPDTPLLRVSIFMSVFDVHINRAPVRGTVRRIAYIAGKFVNADLDKASEENERQHLLFERPDGLRIGCTQIAGLVARRILTFAKEGDILAAGQRFGLIRFGSRVDVFLPDGTAPLAIKGQRAVAGETILAEIGRNEEIFAVGQ